MAGGPPARAQNANSSSQATPSTRPEFEAASVKTAPLEPVDGIVIHFTGGGPGTRDPGLFRCENCTPAELIMTAYDVQSYQISGPDSLNTSLLISAKVPSGATKEQFRQMLQNLLAERFKLALHREKKDVAGYALALGKDGPKLKAPGADAGQSAPERRGTITLDENHFVIIPPGQYANGIQTFRNDTLYSTAAGNASMGQLALELTRELHRPVVDKTGLSGKFQFILYWHLESNAPPDRPANELTMAGTPLPTLSDALQKVGLKLERTKVPGEVLMIDHLEKTPSVN
jgi:uncharacterized protein (TIGR03435 family)